MLSASKSTLLWEDANSAEEVEGIKKLGGN